MKLSKHFSLEEFTRSSTADTYGIDNRLNPCDPSDAKIISNLRALCLHVLEPLREYFGNPIRINSGYRCPELNKAVGGVPNSQHLTGQAADIYLPTIDIGKQWFLWLMDEDFDQLLWERDTHGHIWIHISWAGSQNRHQVKFLTKT